MLRDRLVCGINDQRIQRRLLAEQDLSFAKALEISQAMEAADRNARELGKVSANGLVQAVSNGRSQRGGGAPHTLTCYRCGGKHPSDKCCFKDSECHHCGKKGHIAKVCRSKKRENAKHPCSHSTQEKARTHHVAGEESEDMTESILTVPGQRADPITVTVQVNHANLEMEVDTGASVSLISEATYEQLWPASHRPKMEVSSRKL